MVQGEMDLRLERAIAILTALGGIVERLRRVAGWLRAGRRATASRELQSLLGQLDRLIITLAEGSAGTPLGDVWGLIAELRLVREDIASVGLFLHT